MKITPIEIRQHTFEKGLRGYRPEDVDAFLVSLSQEWERLTGEYKMLKMQLEIAEKELGKLKEVEMTLFRTLKTAEDTSAQITDQANKAGEKYVDEAKHQADEIIADARKRSALMVQDAENQARYLKDNILNDIKSLEHDFKALESYKENLAVQIRTLASNAVDSVDRFEKKFAKQNLKGKIDEVTSQIQDDLTEPESQNENPADSSHESNGQAHTTAELPELIERETSVPESIPVDESVTEKLGEALHSPQHETTEPAAEAEVATNETAPEPVLTEVNTTEAEPATEDVPEEVTAKKSGSFFDQI
ncbi:DivIVA domain-containing protein [Spirosoma radiotolerans]|uniref:Cell division protein DivIVA n=1 Tax=Spirosoma radiotolerans TaxID=1379870 RepID=A0A0E3ZZQ2_9BACT|nr:DivIVA domain-containing protein [Spirosoma radiotolerans]AKD57679.1 cell division protein DivIVA [Spirosoma radiotolerans]